jgi:hypothetical protein
MMSLMFIIRTLSSYLKESTTLALQKEDKKNYSLLGSYHLIALENALMKIVEKILINWINKAIKAYNLLSWNQINTYKDRSTLFMIELLITYV